MWCVKSCLERDAQNMCALTKVGTVLDISDFVNHKKLKQTKSKECYNRLGIYESVSISFLANTTTFIISQPPVHDYNGDRS